MEGWQKLLLAAGGAAGVAGVLYYLLSEDGEGSTASAGDDKKKAEAESGAEVTKEQVAEILKEIVESQEKMKEHMKKVTVDVIATDLPFAEVYKRVQEVQPSDPLEKRGLAMNDFDQLLCKYENDPQIREGISRIMGVPDPSKLGGGKPDVSSKTLVDIHKYMLQELQALVKALSEDKQSYEPKMVTLAAQAIVGAKVEKKYQLTSEDMEHTVMMRHQELATNQEFTSVSMQMQGEMAKLMAGSADA